MSKFAVLTAVCLFASLVPANAQSETPPNDVSVDELGERAEASLTEFRETLDNTLNDYPSARFRGVRARFVRSVYASDEGQSDKVPWTHRGGVVLVLCGEMNAKNAMGGYTGWTKFAFQPSQSDVVTMYDHGKPRKPVQVNLAKNPSLHVANDWYAEETVGLLCGEDAEATDPTDLSDQVAFND